jgi:sigma-54 dependent transcriptional regulator, acetoin dehydrogenase operon transcriptional activator AcoR
MAHGLDTQDQSATKDDSSSRLLLAIERNRWNMTHTAEQLGISRNTLYRRIKLLGIPLQHPRRP